jgi:hypothetical protein
MLHYGSQHQPSSALTCLLPSEPTYTARTFFFWFRVDMRAVEITVQNLIGSGLDPKLENNPYLCFVYTSFQVGGTQRQHAQFDGRDNITFFNLHHLRSLSLGRNVPLKSPMATPLAWPTCMGTLL